MIVRFKLHPKENASNKIIILPTCFPLKKEQREFCRLLKKIKILDSYATNIFRCIDMKKLKINRLKSHDCHIIMIKLLPLALREISNLHVRLHMTESSNYFYEMYSKVAQLQEFMKLEKQILVTLCNLEKMFPLIFFDIMVHLVVHLAYKVRIARPSIYHYTYPIER